MVCLLDWGEINENSQLLLDCGEMGIFRYCSTEKNFPKKNLAVYSKSLNMYIFLMKKIHFWGCILKKYLDKCEKVCIQGYSLLFLYKSEIFEAT